MPYDYIACPECGAKVRQYRNPFPTVDVIIETPKGIVLVQRANEPKGWAIPGGFVDYGESLESAAIREAKEETGLEVTGLKLLGCYSDPHRDERFHTISTVYVAQSEGTPQAGDDAADLALFQIDALPEPLCFDHAQILSDYQMRKKAGSI